MKEKLKWNENEKWKWKGKYEYEGIMMKLFEKWKWYSIECIHSLIISTERKEEKAEKRKKEKYINIHFTMSIILIINMIFCISSNLSLIFRSLFGNM